MPSGIRKAFLFNMNTSYVKFITPFLPIFKFTKPNSHG